MRNILDILRHRELLAAGSLVTALILLSGCGGEKKQAEVILEEAQESVELPVLAQNEVAPNPLIGGPVQDVSFTDVPDDDLKSVNEEDQLLAGPATD